MTRHPWAIALSTLLVSFLLSPASGQEVVRESRVFDIEFLTRAREDHPGPSLKLKSTSMAMPPLMETYAEKRQLSPDVLADMIQVNVDPDSWNNVNNRIALGGGKLFVTQTPENLKRIGDLLADVRARVGDFVEVEGYVLGVKAEYLEGLLGILENTRTGAALGEKAVRSVLGGAVKEGFVRVLDAASVLAFSGQRVHVASVEEHAYIRDQDVEVAQDESTSDPVVGAVGAGFVLDVRPVVGAGDAGVLLDLRLEHQTVLSPFPTVEMDVGTIEIPRVRSLVVQTTTVVPDGGAVLFAGAHQDDGSEAKVMLVRARIKRLASAREPGKTPGAGRRVLRIYNVRILTYNVEDRRAEDEALGMPGASDAGAMGPAFMEEAAPEGLAVTGEDLVEMIRTNVAEDSWANERNSLSYSGGCLVVVQTEDVHAKIDALLKELRRKRVVLVMTTARYLEVDADALRDLMPEGLAGKHTQIDPETRDALLDLARKGDRAATLGLTSHVCFNRQATHIARRNVFAYVADLDVEVAQRASIHDPIMRVLSDGVLLEIEPTLAGDGEHVTLDLNPGLARASQPFREAKVETKQGEATVHLPRVSTERLRTAVTLPDGGAVLFLGGSALARQGRRTALLVSVKLIRLGR